MQASLPARPSILTKSALASQAGKAAIRTAITKGPDGLMQHLAKAAERAAPDPITQARLLLAEQSQNFDVMRGAIGQIGQSLAELHEAAPDAQAQRPQTVALLNAQAEAIQGLTLLVLKGQQVQAELINAVDAQSHRTTQNGMPKWVYYAMGGMMVWSMLGMVFSTHLLSLKEESRNILRLACLCALPFVKCHGFVGTDPCSTPRNYSMHSGTPADAGRPPRLHRRLNRHPSRPRPSRRATAQPWGPGRLLSELIGYANSPVSSRPRNLIRVRPPRRRASRLRHEPRPVKAAPQQPPQT